MKVFSQLGQYLCRLFLSFSLGEVRSVRVGFFVCFCFSFVCGPTDISGDQWPLNPIEISPLPAYRIIGGTK